MIQLYRVLEQSSFIMWTPFPDDDGSEIVSLYESKDDGLWTASVSGSWVSGSWATSDEAMAEIEEEVMDLLWSRIGCATRDYGRARGIYKI